MSLRKVVDPFLGDVSRTNFRLDFLGQQNWLVVVEDGPTILPLNIGQERFAAWAMLVNDAVRWRCRLQQT
jgi:hypothetical protein